MPGYGSPAEFATSCLLLAARALRSHSRRPRSGSDPLHQMLQHVLKYGRVQLVMNFLSGPRREYKTGIAQHAEVREIVGQLDSNRSASSPEVRGPLRSSRRISRRVWSPRARKTAFDGV